MKTSKEERIRELQNRIVSFCLRCPRAKWYCGWVECKVGRRHCHLAKVRRWLDEIKKLEDSAEGVSYGGAREQEMTERTYPRDQDWA